MNFLDYLLLAYLTACATAFLVANRPSVRAARSRRWAARHGLPLTEDVLQRVGSGRAGRGRAIGIGTLVVIWPAFTALALLGPELGDVARALLLAVLAILGSCVGVAVYAFRLAARRAEGPVRVAHSSAPHLPEFVRPALLVGFRATTAIGLAVGVLAGLVTGSGTAWWSSAAAAVGWAATELAAYRLVGAPQHSSRTVDLEVDDALRGELVRDLYSLPVMLGTGAAGTGLVAVAARGPVDGALSAVLACVFGGLAIFGVVLAWWVQLPARRAGGRPVADRPVA